MPFAARAQSSVLYSNNFVNGAEWSLKTIPAGADCGVVPTANFSTNTLPGFAYQIDSWGGGASGWALSSSNALAGSNWTVQAQAKWTKTYHPTIPYYGVGGLLLCSGTNGPSGTNYIWLGFVRGDYDSTGNSWSYPTADWNLGGISGSQTFTGAGAFRDFTNSIPIRLQVSRTNGSDTLTFILDSPLDGTFTNTLTFAGGQLAALDTLQYVGFMNYYSKWQYDNVVVTGAASTVVYANNFEPVPAAGWNAMTPTYGANCGVVESSYFAGSSLAYLIDGFGGGAAGWALNSSPVLAGSTANWTYQGSTKFTQTRITDWDPNQPAYYGTGGLLLCSGTNGISGNNYLWLGFQRLYYNGNDDPNAWVAPTAEWNLAGLTGGGIIYSWSTWANGVTTTRDYNGACRDLLSYTPFGLTVSRTNGSATITYVLNSPVDGSRTCTITFTGAMAAALDTLHYVGMMNYFSDWQYDNLVVTGVSAPPPTLGITVSNATARVFWPSTSDPGFVLESTSDLASPTWGSAGTPFVEGGNNVVTNSLTGSALFYRLKK